MRLMTATYMIVIGVALEAACRTPDSDLPLAAAAHRGDLPAGRTLLAGGVDVDAIDGIGWTALIRATRHGNVGVLTALLEADADPNLTDDRRGWTPLRHAIHADAAESVRTLLDHGADPNLPSERGSPPLHMAAGYGNVALVELLLAYGADPYRTDEDGATPLTAAVAGSIDIDRFTLGQCQTDTVKTLLAQAPDLRLSNSFLDRLALNLARWGGCGELLGLIDRS